MKISNLIVIIAVALSLAALMMSGVGQISKKMFDCLILTSVGFIVFALLLKIMVVYVFQTYEIQYTFQVHIGKESVHPTISYRAYVLATSYENAYQKMKRRQSGENKYFILPSSICVKSIRRLPII